MLKELFENITYGKLFCAVEHTVVQQKKQINFLLLQKQKNEFVIKNNGICFELSDLFKIFNKKQHLFLIVNDKQVLSKIVNGKLEPKKAIQSAFPNLNSNDFYCETYQNEVDTIVSICRKTYIDDIIEKYEKLNLNIIDFSLGNLVVTQLLNYLNIEKIYSSNTALSIKNRTLVDIHKTEKKYSENYIINDLEVNSNSVLGLGGILSYYTGQNITRKNFDKKILELQNRYQQIKIFDLGLKTALGFIFSLLFFNFLIFNYYRDKINVIGSEIQVNENYKNNLLSLKEEVDKKKKIVDEIASSETSKVSLFLDEIGNSTPNTVLLKQVIYQPLIKSIKRDKVIQYQSYQILIVGKSTNGDVFSEWITSLEQEKWIKSITLE